MKPCRVCRKPFDPKPHQLKRYDFACKPCRAQIQRDYGKENREAVNRTKAEWEVRNRVKKRAQMRIRFAVKAGRIQRLPCFVCGEKAEAHHASYDLPLGVTWLCKAHHEQVHHEASLTPR